MTIGQPIDRPHQNFDPDFCGAVIRIGAAVCALILVADIVALLAIDSSTTRCPGWVIPGDRESQPVAIWGFVLFAGLWTFNIAYHAVTWQRFASKIAARIGVAERTWVSSKQFNFWQRSWKDLRSAWVEWNAFVARSLSLNNLLVTVMIGSVVFTAAPLFALVGACV